jgi:hypothetical protein
MQTTTNKKLVSATILKPYKKIIMNSLYPKWGNDISLSTAKSAISAYKQTTENGIGVLELMMFYIETGNKCTVDFGDIDEQFYSSIEGMFEKVVNKIKKSDQNTIDQYLPRLKAVVNSANGIGWGYYDFISECLEATFPSKKN